MDASGAALCGTAVARSFDQRLPLEGFASHALALGLPVVVVPVPGGFRAKYLGTDVASGRFSASTRPLLAFDQISAGNGELLPEDVVNAVLDAVLTCHPELNGVDIALEDGALLARLLASGAVEQREDRVVARPQAFFQQAKPWLGNTPCVYPDTPVLTNGVLHPLRAPKSAGTVYNRYIPWLDMPIGFHVADIDEDLPHFHRWMNDPRVSAIWEDDGNLSYHRDFIAGRLADPRTLPLIGTFGGVPFGYFELYWAKEDRIGPHYEAEGHDRGWHVAIGEDAFRGKPFVSAWLPSLMHYMFLADPRTRRIVGEPVHHHRQQIRNLDRSGFSKIKHIQFPHKTALLVMLLRERFFMDRLLSPDLSGLSGKDGLPVRGSLPRDAA